MIANERQQAILRMLDASALSDNETDSYFDRAMDPDYWRALNPQLSIGVIDTASGQIETDPLTADQISREVKRLREEGYFRTGQLLDTALVDRMRVGVETLRANRWPLVFAFVYDEFWRIARTPSLTRLISLFLGDGYKQNSSFWTYYVAPSRGASGWPPHADAHDADSHLTVWIPLTEATVENGCMYVIPRDRMPDSLPSDYAQFKTVTAGQLGQLLQSAKALPASPGGLLGWNHQLVHWGSISSGHTTPRISIAVEFIAKDYEPCRTELPLLDSFALPALADRMGAIGSCLSEFGRFEPAVTRFRDLGKRLARG